MEIKLRIPHVAWREGRPRYVPSPEDRKLGAKGEDLRHGAGGPWFTGEEALAWARTKSAALKAMREAARSPAPRRPAARSVPGAQPARPEPTVADVVAAYFKSEKFGEARLVGKRKVKPLAAKSQKAYRAFARALERHDGGRLWASVARDLTMVKLQVQITAMHEAIGLSMTRGVKSFLSAAWGHARTTGMVHHSPFGREIKLDGLEPRLRAGSIEEMETLIKAADALGRPDVGDAILMGLMTGQRQGDRLDLTEAGEINGRMLVRQSKTGAVVTIRPDPRLKARLAAARKRRADWTVRPLSLLANEQSRKAWKQEAYYRVFREVRAAAVAGVPVAGYHLAGAQADGTNTLPADPDRPEHWTVRPCPSLAGFNDQDLRDTAVTWLALAGSTIPEIVSVTGHSLASATIILKHYLGQHPELARAALDHLSIWLDEQGSTL